MGEPAAALVLTSVACTRGYRELFTDLNLQLASGQVLRVAGENGSGKTSLLRIISGLAEAADGHIHWRGEAIRSADSSYFSDMLYLGHKPGIKLELTPLENLRVAGALAGYNDDAKILQALEDIGLYGFEEVLCAYLSAGQKRRVALAQLLLDPAKLWILDEPYTSLDVAAVVMLEAIFKQHVAQGGSLIITSHQPVNLRDCDYRQLHLPGGQIEALSS